MKKIIVFAMMLIGLSGCGEGGVLTPEAQQALDDLLAGFTVPQSSTVAAVPTTTAGSGSGAPSTKTCLSSEVKSKITGMRKYDAPDTDYSNAITHEFVEEPILNQFDIIGTILDALDQTHFFSEENINKGPYRALVSFLEEDQGVQQKELQSWIVDSRLEGDAIIVDVWVEDSNVQARFKFFKSSSTTTDSGCGAWEVNANTPNGTFTLSVSENPDGSATYKMKEGGDDYGIKAILVQGSTEGYGKVRFTASRGTRDCPKDPNNTSPCDFTARYAYNENHLAIQKVGDPNPVFKARNDFIRLNHRYALFDQETGEDVLRAKQFGFPIEFEDEEGKTHHGFYGAWQGRHQIHSDLGEPINGGITVRRIDFRDGQTTAEFTTSDLFPGTLVRRAIEEADINLLLGVPVEIFDDRKFNLFYNGTQWVACKDIDFNTVPLTCLESVPFTDFVSLVFNPDDKRRFVHISGPGSAPSGPLDPTSPPPPPTQYRCVLNASNECDFEELVFDPTHPSAPPMPSGVNLVPTAGTLLFVSVGGSIFIEYQGGDFPGEWVVKKIDFFDEQNFFPVFDSEGDAPFLLDEGREFYVHQQGTNYLLKNTGAEYTLSLEIQTAAHPGNATEIYDASWILHDPFGGPDASTYKFDTDQLRLEYATVGPNDSGVQSGDLVERPIYGLVAHDKTTGAVVNDITGNPIQFNWEYPQGEDRWGSTQYLIDSNGEFVILDDPIRFAVNLTDGSGTSRTYHLAYDGWLHGLPDFFREIEFNDFNIDDTIKKKIINIEAGTEVTDETDTTKKYVIKPLEVSIFLVGVSSEETGDALDDPLDEASLLRFTDIPAFQDPNLGDPPDVDGVKYSEGEEL